MTEKKLSDKELLDALRAGWDMLLGNAAMIAMLPLEDWLKAFDRAETLGPVLDPTMYRDYMQDGTGQDIKAVISAAIPLKREVVRLQNKYKDKHGPKEK